MLKNLNEKYSPEIQQQLENENRKSWQKATDLHSLDDKTLLVQTVAQKKEREVISPRKGWGVPHDTVLQALREAQLSENYQQGKTFLISDKNMNSTTSSSSSSNLIINEKPPDIINKLGTTLKITMNEKLNSFLTPEKIATLKATNNFLLGVTLGQFDLKNTKMLRTCSEPDMTKLFEPVEEEIPKIKNNITNTKNKPEMNATNGLGTIRLAKSLEDLDKSEEKLSDSDTYSDVFIYLFIYSN